MASNPYYKPQYTAIADNSVVDLTIVKLHMRVDSTVEDDLIQLYLDAAKQKADHYVNNPFTDTTGNQLTIPSDIEVWVCQTTSKWYYNRTIGTEAENIKDIGSVKWALGSDIDINYDLLKRYRRTPGFGGIFLA